MTRVRDGNTRTAKQAAPHLLALADLSADHVGNLELDERRPRLGSRGLGKQRLPGPCCVVEACLAWVKGGVRVEAWVGEGARKIMGIVDAQK